MRRLENYVRKYGPEFGPKLYHALQSQAAHAGVERPAPSEDRRPRGEDSRFPVEARGESVAEESLPLFPERGDRSETPENVELIAACA